MKRFTDKRIWLAVLLAAGLVAAILWGLSQDGPLPKTGIVPKGVVFSEICAKNEAVIADNDGRYRDYVEIYNGGGDINLQGFYLTDGKNKSDPFGDLPLPSGSYCVVFLDKDLTGFSLKATGGETLVLSTAEDKTVTQITTMPMQANQVMLYGEPEYVVSAVPTPGFSNDEAGLQAFQKGAADENPTLRITEVLTENTSSLCDEKGRFSDALEIHNNSSDPVWLGAFYLSDSAENRFRYRLPGVTVAPGGYQVIFCDGENYVSENGQIHANFGLSSGDTLCLTDRLGRYTTLSVQFPGKDVSLSRDAAGQYKASPVSLGFANDEPGIAAFAASRMEANPALVINEVLLSAAGVPYQGAFSDVVEILNISPNAASTAGWYLSDGDSPYTYALPEKTLAPGERLVIPCAREKTGFALSKGETVSLFAPSGKWACRITCADTAKGESLQRTEDGLYVTGPASLGYTAPADLQISELMSANASYLKGAYGKTADWIELYNGSDHAVNLREYTFSTNKDNLAEYTLPDKNLAPGAYCVIILSEKSISLSGYDRLPINLSSDGESVYVSRGGKVVDYVNLPQLPTDMVYGRENGSGQFSCLSAPTPGSQNTAAVELSANPQALTAQGSYTDAVKVTLSAPGTVYYTTDCTAPTNASTLYTGPITLDKTTVIRAVCYESGKLPSQVVDLTYVVKGGHSLPVVSLVAEPEDLWSEETGIYAMGPNAQPDYPHFGANFWKDWEKTASISLFETDGTGFSVKCGISIFGAYSRGSEKKAFSMHFRDYYGAGELEYPLFGEDGLDSYETFILRCSGQDAFYSRMRDVLLTSIVADKTTVAVQKYRPVVLYLNGQFWGVYFIREKANENYVAGNYHADVADVQITTFNGSDQPDYTALVNYAATHDLSQQEHYDYVCQRMDVDNYIDFMVAQMYIANTDIDNIKFFRTPDMKWTWLFYDTDLSFSSPGYNTVTDYTNPRGTGSGSLSTKLINALLKNQEFREKFLRRFAWQIENIWSTENVSARVDELEALIQPEMQQDCDRWGYSYSGWQGSLAYLRKFPSERTPRMVVFLRDYFGLTDGQMASYGFPVGG